MSAGYKKEITGYSISGPETHIQSNKNVTAFRGHGQDQFASMRYAIINDD